MAKTSMIEREKKRARTVARYAAKRAALKAIIGNRSLPDEERWEAQLKLQALPRNASPVRQQRRCEPVMPDRCSVDTSERSSTAKTASGMVNASSSTTDP